MSENVPAVPQSTAVASWRDKLAQHAKEAAESAASASSGQGFKISAKKGKIYYDGQAVAGNELAVIIADHIFENAYYDSDFDPDNPRNPVCFAFGRIEKEMAPHPDAKKPQADKCSGCAWNEYGSADKGKGKACKNMRRLGLLPATPMEADVLAKAELAFMRVPPTSAKAVDQYVRRMKNQHSLPPYAVVTRLGCVDDEKTQFKVTLDDAARVIDLPNVDELMPALITRHETAAAEIEFPYAPPPDLEEKPKAKGRGKF